MCLLCELKRIQEELSRAEREEQSRVAARLDPFPEAFLIEMAQMIEEVVPEKYRRPATNRVQAIECIAAHIASGKMAIKMVTTNATVPAPAPVTVPVDISQFDA